MIELTCFQSRRQLIEYAVTDGFAPGSRNLRCQNAVCNGAIGGKGIIALVVHNLDGFGSITGNQTLRFAKGYCLVKVPGVAFCIVTNLHSGTAQLIAAVQGQREGNQHPTSSCHSLGSHKLDFNGIACLCRQVAGNAAGELCIPIVQTFYVTTYPLLDIATVAGQGSCIVAKGNGNSVHGCSIVAAVQIQA